MSTKIQKRKRGYSKAFCDLSRKQKWKRAKQILNTSSSSKHPDVTSSPISDVTQHVSSRSFCARDAGQDSSSFESARADASSSLVIDSACSTNVSDEMESNVGSSDLADSPIYGGTSTDSTQSNNVVQIPSHSVKEKDSLKDIIQDWALAETNVPKLAVTRLLKKLHTIDSTLPTSYSTLLPAPLLSYIPMDGGIYVHFPNWIDALKHLLQKAFSGVKTGSVEYCLIVNIDGLPLFKHSPDYKIYPILCSVYNISSRPICCGMFSTEKSKNRELPNPEVFLADFLKDFEFLVSNAFILNDVTFNLAKNLIFACDAPIRSSLKKIKSHSGYSSCERCTIRGEYDSHSGHVCLIGNNAKKRDNADFVLQSDVNHHVGTSVLVNYNVNMVHSFALDYMHLSCLGVTKRMLMWWKGVRRQYHAKLHSTAIEKINAQIELCKRFFPCEFKRKLRPLSELAYWKASELRSFMLYTGVVMLRGKDILSKPRYRHFLKFCVAMRIMISDNYPKVKPEVCSKLLKKFVCDAAKLYGKGLVSYNVHSLEHIVEDWKSFGSLELVNCFAFESYLGILKNSIRSGFRPLQQVAFRAFYENKNIESTFKKKLQPFELFCPLKKGDTFFHERPHIASEQYQKANLPNGCLLNIGSVSDSTVSYNGKVFKVVSLFFQEKSFFMEVQKYQQRKPFFKHPLLSNDVGIYLLDCVLESYDVISPNADMKKCMLLPHQSSYVAIEIIHAT